MSEKWSLYILGCRGSYPTTGKEYQQFGGDTSCYLLKRGRYALVLDCGSGLYQAAELLRDCDRIDLLLSHLHYDHLLGLLKWGVFPPAAELRLISTFDRWFGQDTLRRFMGPPFWPYTPANVTLVSVDSPGEMALGDGVTARFCPSNHPDSANLIRVQLGDRSVCLACDYEHGRPFPMEMAQGCDALIYDAMFTQEEYPAHRGWGHSCWQQGCALAKQAGVARLLISHHDPNKTDQTLLAMEQEARQTMPTLRFVRAGDVFSFDEGEEG